MQKTKIYAIAAFLLSALLLCREVCLGDTVKRQKVIDFEDEVVEGLNKRPLDSLNQISEADRKRHKPHLYRKRAGFRTETAESLQQMRFEQ
jgi:hypothetical protein